MAPPPHRLLHLLIGCGMSLLFACTWGCARLTVKPRQDGRPEREKSFPKATVFPPASPTDTFYLALQRSPSDAVEKEDFFRALENLPPNWNVEAEQGWWKLVEEVARFLPAHAGGTAARSYTLGKRLGGGGFKDVYEVKGRPQLVIKKGKLGLSDEDLYQFTSMAAMFELSKRGDYDGQVLASFHDLFLDGENLYMVQERCDEDMSGVLQPWNAFHVSRDMLRGVAFMHKNGFVHRDLKPENLLKCGSDIKVMDFDLATKWRKGDEKLTKYLGTPYFMTMRDYDGQKADSFAAGMTMYIAIRGWSTKRFEKEARALAPRALKGPFDFAWFRIVNPKHHGEAVKLLRAAKANNLVHTVVMLEVAISLLEEDEEKRATPTTALRNLEAEMRALQMSAASSFT